MMLVQFSSFSKNVNVNIKMLEYIATRPGVVKEENYQKTATLKQINWINDIVDKNKNLKNLPEYLDYRDNASLASASVFISEASTQLSYSGNDEMLSYIATRPGVVKDGFSSHGLFSSSSNIDLELEKQKILDNPQSNVWTHILSLTREDAIKLNMNTRKDWENLIKSNIHAMANNFNVSINNLEWNAAFHDEAHHPHVHLQMYSTDDKEGVLSRAKTIQALEKNRKLLTDIIYKDDRQLIIEKHNELSNNFKAFLHGTLSGDGKDLYLNNEQIIFIKQLKKDIDLLSGKKTYSYLPNMLKLKINELFRSIISNQGKDILNEYIKINKEYLSLYNQEENIIDAKIDEKIDILFNPKKSNKNIILHNILIDYIKSYKSFDINIVDNISNNLYDNSNLIDEEVDNFFDEINKRINNAFPDPLVYETKESEKEIINNNFYDEADLIDTDTDDFDKKIRERISDNFPDTLANEKDELYLKNYFSEYFKLFYSEYYKNFYPIYYDKLYSTLASSYFKDDEFKNMNRKLLKNVNDEVMNEVTPTLNAKGYSSDKITEHLFCSSVKAGAAFKIFGECKNEQKALAKEFFKDEIERIKAIKRKYYLKRFSGINSINKMLLEVFNIQTNADKEAAYLNRKTSSIQHQNVIKTKMKERGVDPNGYGR